MSRFPYLAPTVTAAAGFSVYVSGKTTWVFLRLGFADGSEGWGEATHFGSEAELAQLIFALDQRFQDHPAPGLAAACAPLMQSYLSPARRALCSAIEQAFADAQALRTEQSFAAQFGGPARTDVPFYANINRGIRDRSPEGFAEQARMIVQKTGAMAVKIAPFDGIRWGHTDVNAASALTELGLARIAAVRDILPDGAKLMVDCHGRFTPFMAKQMIRCLGKLGVFWVEEPCDMLGLSAADQRALRSAAHDAGMMLAGGEEICSTGQMAGLLAAEGHDVVLPDLRLTGLAHGIAMLDLAADKQVQVSLHNPVGPVLDAVSTQLAASLPRFLILERQVGETPLFDKIRGTEVRVVGGAVRLPKTPSLGFSPDLTALTPLAEHRSKSLSFAGMAGAGPDA